MRPNLQGAKLCRAKLTQSIEQPGAVVDLRGAKLQGADLSYADLTGANLQDLDLRDSDLTGTKLTDANLKNTRLPS